MADPVIEQLTSANLPELIVGLGLAVADANKKIGESDEVGDDLMFTIPTAEIEIKLAFSGAGKTETAVAGEFGISAFSINASYSRTYSFSESAASTIKLTLQAKPRNPAA